MPVGMFSDARFEIATFQLDIGDRLIAYTDGITEVQNPQSEFWGQERFEQLLSSCSCGEPKEIMERILDEVSGFAGGQPQHDDMTLVVMKVEEGCEGVALTPASVRRVTELVHEKIEDELSLDEMAQSAGLNVRFSASGCAWIGVAPICARLAERRSVGAVAACCWKPGTPALRRLVGESCASNALPANAAEFRNISRRVLCFSENLALIFVRRLSNVNDVYLTC
jgi:hypothetical protein